MRGSKLVRCLGFLLMLLLCFCCLLFAVCCLLFAVAVAVVAFGSGFAAICSAVLTHSCTFAA
ncbi:hypothetical protein G8D19_17170 [Xanthomonas vesicatoria]|uniref:hypothetical protein n=1 Tax=Xanthomonas vesicatoria TaxID=56460 RepID=UPI001364D6E6|nr:hypothetical protein [Xanthomonas vesicatoria]MDG4490762.1 hypothetical protein [Xanthomonas vesicatoria]